VSGRVSKYDISYKGEEVTVNMYQPPSFFPVSHVLIENEATFFYKCDSDCVLQCAPLADVKKFLIDNPDVVFDLMTRVYKGIDVILRRLVHRMAGSAAERLVYELIAESERFGVSNDDTSFTLSMSEGQLASQAGLSRETVSREMTKLKALGVASVHGKGITIADLSKLKQFLGSKS
jgi:CRP/FNR family transcriptional regulator